MAKVEVRVRTGSGEGEGFGAFPADTYVCQVRNAELVESQFKDDKTGETQWQIKITWEVVQLTPEQEEAELETGKWFFQWLAPYYSEGKKGPSKFKLFIDSLLEQGALAAFDPNDFDTDELIGIKQKVTVQEFKRTDGSTGNKVTGVLPLKLRKAAPRAEPAPPPAGVTRKGAPPMRNQPVAVAETDDDEIPF